MTVARLRDAQWDLDGRTLMGRTRARWCAWRAQSREQHATDADRCSRAWLPHGRLRRGFVAGGYRRKGVLPPAAQFICVPSPRGWTCGGAVISSDWTSLTSIRMGTSTGLSSQRWMDARWSRGRAATSRRRGTRWTWRRGSVGPSEHAMGRHAVDDGRLHGVFAPCRCGWLAGGAMCAHFPAELPDGNRWPTQGEEWINCACSISQRRATRGAAGRLMPARLASRHANLCLVRDGQRMSSARGGACQAFEVDTDMQPMDVALTAIGQTACRWRMTHWPSSPQPRRS
jgi:hypothetical protein